MYQDYKSVAQFYIVYISEAHAADDARPVQYAKQLGIKEHTNYGERCAVAEKLFADKQLSIPCLVDGMGNEAADAYEAWPDRLFLIRKDGKLAVAANRGPWGFKPALDEAAKWLKEFQQTGKEPNLPSDADAQSQGR